MAHRLSPRSPGVAARRPRHAVAPDPATVQQTLAQYTRGLPPILQTQVFTTETLRPRGEAYTHRLGGLLNFVLTPELEAIFFANPPVPGKHIYTMEKNEVMVRLGASGTDPLLPCGRLMIDLDTPQDHSVYPGTWPTINIDQYLGAISLSLIRQLSRSPDPAARRHVYVQDKNVPPREVCVWCNKTRLPTSTDTCRPSFDFALCKKDNRYHVYALNVVSNKLRQILTDWHKTFPQLYDGLGLVTPHWSDIASNIIDDGAGVHAVVLPGALKAPHIVKNKRVHDAAATYYQIRGVRTVALASLQALSERAERSRLSNQEILRQAQAVIREVKLWRQCRGTWVPLPYSRSGSAMMCNDTVACCVRRAFDPNIDFLILGNQQRPVPHPAPVSSGRQRAAVTTCPTPPDCQSDRVSLPVTIQQPTPGFRRRRRHDSTTAATTRVPVDDDERSNGAVNDEDNSSQSGSMGRDGAQDRSAAKRRRTKTDWPAEMWSVFKGWLMASRVEPVEAVHPLYEPVPVGIDPSHFFDDDRLHHLHLGLMIRAVADITHPTAESAAVAGGELFCALLSLNPVCDIAKKQRLYDKILSTPMRAAYPAPHTFVAPLVDGQRVAYRLSPVLREAIHRLATFTLDAKTWSATVRRFIQRRFFLRQTDDGLVAFNFTLGAYEHLPVDKNKRGDVISGWIAEYQQLCTLARFLSCTNQRTFELTTELGRIFDAKVNIRTPSSVITRILGEDALSGCLDDSLPRLFADVVLGFTRAEDATWSVADVPETERLILDPSVLDTPPARYLYNFTTGKYVFGADFASYNVTVDTIATADPVMGYTAEGAQLVTKFEEMLTQWFGYEPQLRQLTNEILLSLLYQRRESHTNSILPILYGSGGNGKSLFEKILRNAFSASGLVVDMDKGFLGGGVQLTSFVTHLGQRERLVLCSEYDFDDMNAAAKNLLKTISGNDPIAARQAYDTQYQARRCRGTLIVSSNSLPRLTYPIDRPLARRIVPLFMRKVFTSSATDRLEEFDVTRLGWACMHYLLRLNTREGFTVANPPRVTTTSPVVRELISCCFEKSNIYFFFKHFTIEDSQASTRPTLSISEFHGAYRSFLAFIPNATSGRVQIESDGHGVVSAQSKSKKTVVMIDRDAVRRSIPAETNDNDYIVGFRLNYAYLGFRMFTTYEEGESVSLAKVLKTFTMDKISNNLSYRIKQYTVVQMEKDLQHAKAVFYTEPRDWLPECQTARGVGPIKLGRNSAGAVVLRDRVHLTCATVSTFQ